MKPRIGLTTFSQIVKPYISLNKDYTNSVGLANGVPLLLPILDVGFDPVGMLSGVDALILTGGGDVDPKFFNQTPHEKLGSVDFTRDVQELALFNLAIEIGMPVLGICRGVQLMNIAMGGDLHQDIPSCVLGASDHSGRGMDMNVLSHMVSIKGGSMLAEIFNSTSLMTNSFHHQAVDKLGNNMVATAWSEDTIIEAIEYTGSSFALGVQWHPESLTKEHLVFRTLFSRLILEAEQFRMKRV